MREIIFRGKRMDNGEWVYGWPFADTADCSLKKVGKCVCPHDGSEYFIVEWVDDFHEYEEREVIPDTVGQYTGLTDKNGKRIFEGDIVKTSDITHEGVIQIPGESFEIAMRKGCWAMVAGEDWDFLETNHECIQVIGNIHDNPELLKGGEG